MGRDSACRQVHPIASHVIFVQWLLSFETKEYILAPIVHERVKFSVQCSPNTRRMAQN